MEGLASDRFFEAAVPLPPHSTVASTELAGLAVLVEVVDRIVHASDVVGARNALAAMLG